ncbi:hypothetical protein [Nocardia sp. IFM 10818]
MRTRLITLTVSAVAVTALAGAGAATAATPLVGPGAVGVELSPGKTAALADSPVPAVVDTLVPYDLTTVSLAPSSQLEADDAWRFASLHDIIGETVDHPGGHVVLGIAAEDGLIVIQDW